VDANSLSRPHSAEIAILGDAAGTLSAIAQLISPRQPGPPQSPPPTEQSPLRQMLATILKTVRQSLPRDTIICSDMTQIAYAANEVFPVFIPRTWIHPVGFGTLGFGLPAAIGAKFAVPHTPVVALVGDYGFQYTLNEMGTAVEHELPLIILLWNNEVLGAIKDDMTQKGIQPNAVTLRNPDFQALAVAYGAKAERPENLNALSAAIARALKAPGPTVIEMTPRLVHG
jgi:5-guanidino-2-oxopentanoate decarboxylase